MNLMRLAPKSKDRSQRFTAAERNYFAWMHRECTCCLTGYPEFEIAHTGGLSEGKGTSRKSWLNTCLPIRKELHLVEERNRSEFWSRAGFEDHLAWADRLHEIYTTEQDPNDLVADMQDLANRDWLVECLK